MKISNKWRNISEIYKYFCPKEECYDFSEESALEMFSFESSGYPKFAYFERRPNGLFNGYAVGKHWMDVTIAMWRKDIDSGLLDRQELYDDPNIPNWFLEKLQL